MPSIARYIRLRWHNVHSHACFIDGDVVESCFHSDAITTPTYFDTVYSVLLTEMFIHYTTVYKETMHSISTYKFVTTINEGTSSKCYNFIAVMYYIFQMSVSS